MKMEPSASRSDAKPSDHTTDSIPACSVVVVVVNITATPALHPIVFLVCVCDELHPIVLLVCVCVCAMNGGLGISYDAQTQPLI